MRYVLPVALVALAGTTLGFISEGFPRFSEIDEVEPGSMDDFNGCGMSGSITDARQDKYWLNRGKNRYSAPEFAPFVDLDNFLTADAGDNPAGLDEDDGVTVEGYIAEVKRGGKESTNCSPASLNDYNTDEHIYLMRTMDEVRHFRATRDKRRVVVIETTPRVKELARRNGHDWTYRSLKRLEGKKVRVKGWMLLDTEHIRQSHVDGATGGPSRVHRGTAWEVHPITSIEVIGG